VTGEDRSPGHAFFGRRKGHRLRDRGARLVAELLPKLRLPAEGPIAPLRPLFPANVAEVWLEIGFGGGEHLVAAALAHRDIGFIGCEPFVNGMAKALAAIDTHRLDNIRLHDGDATLLLPRLPQSSIPRVFLLYPDPWPKRRQRKRRFVSDATIAELARIMKPGATFRFATDIDDYAGWTLARLKRSGLFVWTAERADDWRKPFPEWPGTRYEAKAIREGRRPVYLTFVRS
jgi:tRNA (guanine-N7-)-methyltransferase